LCPWTRLAHIFMFLPQRFFLTDISMEKVGVLTKFISIQEVLLKIILF
jgi:hypothetical protein